MKQKISIKQVPKQVLRFSPKTNASLKVLEMSNDELYLYMKEFTFQPSLSNISVDSDVFLEYDHHLPSLKDTIYEQASLSKYSIDLDFLDYALSMLDSNGYFKISINELVGQSIYAKDFIIKQLSILRTFEPHGCFSFSLAECLKIQCTLDKQSIAKTALILCDFLEDIAIGDIDHIQQKTNLNEKTIIEGIEFIRNLHPKPAANFATTSSYLQPEFIIKNVDGKITVILNNNDFELNTEIESHDQISNELLNQKEKFSYFMSLIEKRNITLLQVMNEIIHIQSDFFLYHKNLNKCTLQMIANKCNLHTSTVSRAIANKSCLFENTYYSLKSFLESGGNDKYTSNHIKQVINDFIHKEDKNNPLSDETISHLLESQGINISRRAVAKYRSQMHIFSSMKRKQKR